MGIYFLSPFVLPSPHFNSPVFPTAGLREVVVWWGRRSLWQPHNPSQLPAGHRAAQWYLCSKGVSEMVKWAVRTENSSWTGTRNILTSSCPLLCRDRWPGTNRMDGHHSSRYYCGKVTLPVIWTPQNTHQCSPNVFTLSPSEFGCEPREKSIELRLSFHRPSGMRTQGLRK